MSDPVAEPVIGLALGSGASRGWAHVGVMNALTEAGVDPAVICGTSVGAMIGASHIVGRLGALTEWVLGSTRTDVLRFFDIKPTKTGFVDTERFDRFLEDYVAPDKIRVEDLDSKFVAVSTDLDTGREVWCQAGSLAHAVRASMAMPGLFPAVRDDGRWLVDGGLVNPVPVSVCRAMGADVVIAVNLNFDILGKRRRIQQRRAEDDDDGVLGSLKKQAREYRSALFANSSNEEAPPGLFHAIPGAINIFQDRITRSRLVGDPADVMLAPKVGHIGILEFQRAGEAIEIGKDCVQAALGEIQRALGLDR